MPTKLLIFCSVGYLKQIFVHSMHILSTDRTLEHCRPQDQAQLCGDVGGEGGIKY